PLLARPHTSRSSGCPARCPRPYAGQPAVARAPRSRAAEPSGSHPCRIRGSSNPSRRSISPARRACGAGPPGVAQGARPAAPPRSRSTTPGSETAPPSAQTARAPTQPSRPAGPNGAASDAPPGRSSTARAAAGRPPRPPAAAQPLHQVVAPASSSHSRSTTHCSLPALPLLPQHRHHQRVSELPIDQPVLPEEGFTREAALLVAADCAPVVLVRGQLHAVKFEILEGVAEHQPHRVRTEPLAPEHLVLDRNAHLRP